MTTEGVHSRRVALHDYPPPGDPSLRVGTTPKPVGDAMRALFARIERSHDAGIIAAAHAAAPTANTDILYVGLNPESERAETGALAKTGQVKTVRLGSTINGVSYDFASAKTSKRSSRRQNPFP